ncbi:hypothetical protein HK405_012611 [Cladochytrium tenue]|nr:hypothetical protein HK405_012611 [Cladochytrium tenue]
MFRFAPVELSRFELQPAHEGNLGTPLHPSVHGVAASMPPYPLRQAPLHYPGNNLQPSHSSLRLPAGAGQSLAANYSQPRLAIQASPLSGSVDYHPNNRDNFGVAAADDGGMPFAQDPTLLDAAAAATTAASGLQSPHENGLAVQTALFGFPSAEPGAAMAVVPSSLPIAPDPRALRATPLPLPRQDYAPPVPGYSLPPPPPPPPPSPPLPPLVHPAAQQQWSRPQFPGSQMDAHRAFDPDARAQHFQLAQQPQPPPLQLQGQQQDYSRRSRSALRDPPAASPPLYPQPPFAGPVAAVATQHLPRV